MVGQLENGGGRLDARPSNGGIVRLLEGSDERVDGRVANAGRLNAGAVQDEDGHGAEKVDVVEVVHFALDEKSHSKAQSFYQWEDTTRHHEKVLL